MNTKLKTFFIWFFAFIFTAAIAVYQRMTGPTFPVRGKIEIGSQVIKYQLLTSSGDNTDAQIFLEVPDRSITGEIHYRRFKSEDVITNLAMKRVGDYLITFIPHQPPAGKISYQITLVKDNQTYNLTKTDISIRFKGATPALFLIPHIFFIFLAMLFSTITGIEAIFKRNHLLLYTWLTLITLLLGGLILGPIVQKFSFGSYWTGWPFGHDLTDNKSLIAFIFWLIALIAQYRYRGKRAWAIIAAFVLLVVFLIPHSVLGSEIDYSKEQKTEAHGN